MTKFDETLDKIINYIQENNIPLDVIWGDYQETPEGIFLYKIKVSNLLYYFDTYIINVGVNSDVREPFKSLYLREAFLNKIYNEYIIRMAFSDVPLEEDAEE